ncbi:type II toxin-antitoxin system VapC family toxin [Candidatus Parabeggiatoa sp. HSG14]|uniref:type II toxin-antitoxin system VapC family toxin n=1 Tax=Candidatus Parabeggiatoa sp. HSG14 TaxID=3055593 RepID=UPI0025A77C24|nr:type II toxin-antitoxin system VapC family toxin [Thiotrichales bacterium HSG14]
MNLFVDTSALVKLYHQEIGTDNLVNSLRFHSVNNLIITITDISRIECHSALMKRVRIGEMRLKNVREALTLFEQEIEMFHLVEVDVFAKEFAVHLLDEIAHKHNLATLDAMQLATAILSHQAMPVDYFVACDKRLLNFAKKYFNVFNPEIETI